MKRRQLEHILRAAAEITGASQFVIIGSQAILGQFEDPPVELLVSIEADIFSMRDPRDADLIDGSIGELSLFHQSFGYYAHGVSPDTAVLPRGWEDRLISFRTDQTGGATGLCLEVHDLAVAKIIAGRPKDIQFVSGLIRHGMADAESIRDRLELAPVDDATRKLCFDRISRLAHS